MRKKVIIGNWKMNQDLSGINEFFNQLENENFNNHTAVVCVPSVYAKFCQEKNKNSKIMVGVQNMFFEEQGAYTGETSPKMLNDLEIDYVIIGHSERRDIFHEDNEMINKKVHAAIKHNITPIFALGESLALRESGEWKQRLKWQLTTGLMNVASENAEKIIIAYEPIWAIGTGVVASSDQAEEACKFIRETIADMYNDEIASKIIIQYGGSVTPESAPELLNMPNIDGALVGGASLQADSFKKLFNI